MILGIQQVPFQRISVISVGVFFSPAIIYWDVCRLQHRDGDFLMERDILQVPLRPVVRTKLASLGFGKMGSFSPDSSELLSKGSIVA